MNISDQDINIIFQDTVRQKRDTTHQQLKISADTTSITDTVPVKKIVIRQVKKEPLPVDTTAVCSKNPVSDLIFPDTTDVITVTGQQEKSLFPFIFIEKNRKRESDAIAALVKHLKDGRELPARAFHDDWMIIIIIFSAFIFSLIHTFSKKFLPEIIRFLFFRGIGDPASRDIAGLFHWHSTLTNLITFLSLALFVYCTGFYYNLIPDGMSGFVFWVISFIIIIISVTLRHIICYITGKISGQKDLFNEYIITVYHFYHFSALALFLIVILLSYTRIFTPDILFKTGFILFAFLFLYRIIRLFLIFIKRNFSILYLILYLCALEFLPVLVILKYFTGQF
jgi:hypothetical protein